jgi:hypothetical protein
MRAFRSVGLVVCVALTSASAAFAQQSVPHAPGLDQSYMMATAGASFGDQQAATFGVEFGEPITRHVHAYATFNYFDNLLNEAAETDLANLGAALTRLTATPWELSGNDRGLSFSGGAKFVMANGSPVRPYVGGGPGVINIRRTVYESVRGEISDEVLAVFGAPDGAIDAQKEGTFRPFAEVLAGVGVAAGRTYVDVGYRYRKAFKTSEPLTFSQFSVGVGMRF